MSSVIGELLPVFILIVIGYAVRAAGIALPDEVLVTDRDGLDAAIERAGFPLVMKIQSPDIAHKSEIGGVIVGLQDEAQVRAAFGTLLQRAKTHAPQARIDGVVVAQMAGKGVETILGVVRDPVFGAVVMFGLGGVFVEAFKDVALQLLGLLFEEFLVREAETGQRKLPRASSNLSRRVVDFEWSMQSIFPGAWPSA